MLQCVLPPEYPAVSRQTQQHNAQGQYTVSSVQQAMLCKRRGSKQQQQQLMADAIRGKQLMAVATHVPGQPGLLPTCHSSSLYRAS